MARISIEQKSLFVLLLIVILLAAGILAYQFLIPKPIMDYNYYGIEMRFRADLREADKIPVYPSKEAINEELMSPFVENITIAFKPAEEKENPYYVIEMIEIVQKLDMGYYGFFGYEPQFDSIPVDSYENLSGKQANPIIALVHPVYSNKTSIELSDHVVFVKAKDYRDFDLAAVKLIMSVLNITVV